LNTIKRSPDAQNENWLNSIAGKRPTKTPCSLCAIDSPIPKLDVAGSTPVSRSIFSITQQLLPLHSTPLSRALVGCYLRINARIVTEAGLRPA
jgi:hypothetical protein